MCDKYTHAPNLDVGSTNIKEWIKNYVINNPMGKYPYDRTVQIKTPDGKIVQHPAYKSAIICGEFVSVRGKQYAVIPEYICDYLVDFETSYNILGELWESGKETPFMKSTYAIIPIGYPETINNEYVFQLSARTYVSRGENTSNMSNENVSNMLISTMRQLIWIISNETNKEKYSRYIEMLILLAETTREYFNKYPDSYIPVCFLAHDDYAEDVIQRAIAISFMKYDQQWTKEDFYKLICTMLKRMNKHHSDINILKNLQGPFGCLIIAPTLREYLNSSITIDQTIEIINTKIQSLLNSLSTMLNEKELNTKILMLLISLIDKKFLSTEKQINELLIFCKDDKNFKKQAPLYDIGILEKQKLPFLIYIGESNIYCHRKFTSGYKVNIINTNAISVTASNPCEWEGIHLTEKGYYEITPYPYGNIFVGSGQKELFLEKTDCLLRFTSGDEIFSTNIRGISSAGNIYIKRGMTRQYVHKHFPLKLDKCTVDNGICIDIFDTKYVISQNDDTFYEDTFTMGNKFLLAFKGMKLCIKYSSNKTFRDKHEDFTNLNQKNLSLVGILKQLQQKVSTGEIIDEHLIHSTNCSPDSSNKDDLKDEIIDDKIKDAPKKKNNKKKNSLKQLTSIKI